MNQESVVLSSHVRPRISISSRVLLIEIERRCSDPLCNAKARVGLTKDEARRYCGFECEQCKRWNRDGLNERDAPDWWEELAITDMYTLRENGLDVKAEPSDTVARLSDDYRRMNSRDEGGGMGDEKV
jgi:hypothetical protein